MKSATLTALALIGAVSWTPSVSYAARGDYDRAGSERRCVDAVSRKLLEAPGVRDVQISDRTPEISRPSQDEVLVVGDGDYRTESRQHFSYSCTDNLRSGVTRADISPPPPSAKKDKKGAAVAGVLIGAAVLAAIAASNKNDDRDHHHGGGRSFSPSDGITCFPRDQACYHDRGHRFSERWTQRVYGRR